MPRGIRRSTALRLVLYLALAAVAARAGAVSVPSPAAATESSQLPKMTTEPQGGKRSAASPSHSAGAVPAPAHEVMQLGRKSKGFG